MFRWTNGVRGLFHLLYFLFKWMPKLFCWFEVRTYDHITFCLRCRGCNYFLSLNIPVSAWLLKALDAVILIRKWQWCNCILIFLEKWQFAEEERVKGKYIPSYVCLEVADVIEAFWWVWKIRAETNLETL